MSYDVVIPIVERNVVTLSVLVKKIKENLDADSLIFIGNYDLESKISMLECEFVDEDKLYKGLTYVCIRELIIERDPFAAKRAGWYLQQFLKMAYALVCKKAEYLVWDADTIPLKKINMHNNEQIPYFDVKDEYHRPYFHTMKKLFNISVARPGYSFISEHMLIITSYMKELISLIENNENIKGDTFFEKTMRGIKDIDLLRSGFSEFETYGNYVMMRHPCSYGVRKLSTLRDSSHRICSVEEIEEFLNGLDTEYEIVTIENK